MCAHNCIRYLHHKSPYENFIDSNFYNVRKKNLPYCRRAITPIWKEKYDDENPQITPAMQYPVPAPETAEVHNDSSPEEVHNDSGPETDMTIHTATDANPPDPADGQRLIEEEPADDSQNISKSDTSDVSAVGFDEDEHKEQTVNRMMDAASRLTDAAARLLDVADTKSFDSAEHCDRAERCDKAERCDRAERCDKAERCDRAKRCGLLHFREWWELVEVSISVGGERITGIPIFVEEDTLRVINKNYSYFIPLKKVDYIRTADGLCSGFDVSDDKPRHSRL